MHIAGGLYRELCLHPHWDALLGSGGRAARALSRLSPGTIFSCYFERPHDFDTVLSALGVSGSCAFRPDPIAFAYFHPLSRPHLQPARSELRKMPPLKIEGRAALRFGFLEGDAIVNAEKAVYDPQTTGEFPPFFSNGSTAKQLALVLNEQELLSVARIDDVEVAAASILESHRASCIVVKRGIKGVAVFEPGSASRFIPAFRSTRVFKIGTGDVFSAAFAYYWAELGHDPFNASLSASKQVARYCDNPLVPLAPLASSAHDVRDERHPVCEPRTVLLLGAIKTLGQRYSIEEARYSLVDLGLTVICPALENVELSNVQVSTVLLLADGIDADMLSVAQRLVDKGARCVALAEMPHSLGQLRFLTNCETTDDFSTALYLAGWNN
ncbi:PfkB family carbohydrate kinase (plasmid) [Agrobacterium leguminum]|uniref:Nucleoside 2-deoxyribosyltransferase protein n=1 Tax=Agrobacterium deltaense NCPPB 1641 TaxID=1183425 RepID=A0A1S7U7E3_9HYPH|nr:MULTISPECIES: PfkB family carbohydrate kinase [Agrobacterium]WFS69862.1 PfkB family carbohydrate kinase [Agrobacterium leguminum]CVI62773.1 putative nucleoside 2-deoxyribosyltransferase protein [Agrobacterium deltaense NCPPB 1641]